MVGKYTHGSKTVFDDISGLIMNVLSGPDTLQGKTETLIGTAIATAEQRFQYISPKFITTGCSQEAAAFNRYV